MAKVLPGRGLTSSLLTSSTSYSGLGHSSCASACSNRSASSSLLSSKCCLRACCWAGGYGREVGE